VVSGFRAAFFHLIYLFSNEGLIHQAHGTSTTCRRNRIMHCVQLPHKELLQPITAISEPRASLMLVWLLFQLLLLATAGNVASLVYHPSTNTKRSTIGTSCSAHLILGFDTQKVWSRYGLRSLLFPSEAERSRRARYFWDGVGFIDNGVRFDRPCMNVPLSFSAILWVFLAFLTGNGAIEE
jgi:hypothetical protein